MTPTPEQIAKLPKWAQDHIRNLERTTAHIQRELKEWNDSQTPSSIYVDETVCDKIEGSPSSFRRYVQGYGVVIEHAGVVLHVSIFEKRGIALKWGALKYSMSEIAFIPVSYQAAELHSKEHMR